MFNWFANACGTILYYTIKAGENAIKYTAKGIEYVFDGTCSVADYITKNTNELFDYICGSNEEDNKIEEAEEEPFIGKRVQIKPIHDYAKQISYDHMSVNYLGDEFSFHSNLDEIAGKSGVITSTNKYEYEFTATIKFDDLPDEDEWNQEEFPSYMWELGEASYQEVFKFEAVAKMREIYETYQGICMHKSVRAAYTDKRAIEYINSGRFDEYIEMRVEYENDLDLAREVLAVCKLDSWSDLKRIVNYVRENYEEKN